MDTDGVIQLIIILILIMLSAFFSSAETALTTVNRVRLKAMAEEGNKRAKTALSVLEQYGKMLSAILIGNNVVNLTASSLATTLAPFQCNTWGLRNSFRPHLFDETPVPTQFQHTLWPCLKMQLRLIQRA